jgi:catechol 2,3-dioxygenase-like lactoylglutathione lyase family enzyme
MTPLRLDHVTITSTCTDRTVKFFGDILGLRPGFRPELGVGGVWLYASGGDYPILHIIDRKPEGRSTGAFDHFAVPGTEYTQVHFFNPDGVKIEVIFAERVDQSLLN